MSQKLVKSTSTVAFFTLLSRIMGFVRDIILANIFGAGGMSEDLKHRHSRRRDVAPDHK